MPKIKVGLVSLGCAKNLIDSEIMIGHLDKAGMTMTSNAREADVVIVNTCSFIDASKKESLQAIFDMRSAAPKQKRQKLIVAGCLSQRYQGELPKLLPEVDAFIGLDQIAEIVPIIEKVIGPRVRLLSLDSGPQDFVTERPSYIPDYDTPRFRLTPKHAAYIKIAEGCNHHCSFCIIPKIRGRHRSRSIDSIVKEARHLVAEGVKEINLISQDTTYFGMDKWEGERPNKRSPVDSSRGESLAMLIRELNKIKGDFWIRLLYTHPAHWSDELIQAIAESPKVARYVDIPLQHISDKMLAAMKRETDGKYIRDLIQRIRKGIPGIAVRTTFIVGFPGESDADFEELMEFIEETRFERVGVFKYSREEGTSSAKQDGQIHHRTKDARWKRAMELLQRISVTRNQTKVGQRIRVLVEAPGVGRTEADAMEIDGTVLIPPHLPLGDFCEVTVNGFQEYDLIAS
ncbi:MAG: 30S ribosomal protein S12 methylthiotransferase RimO [Puniceicoccales bacterium]|jgi:ribosomal protein S12 methylthiotransferase|nr:30S ribosomal protein S12 methylthiotransferase RimO [Puniceicoccales bacterium]